MKFKQRTIFLVLIFCAFSLNTYAADLKPSEVHNFYIGDNQPADQSEGLPSDISTGAEEGYPWRGILLGGDHGSGDIHHDNTYVSIDGGPIIYQTTIPARKEGNNLSEDEGLLWHFYTIDDTEITVYASSSWVNGISSDLSIPFPIYFSYPQPATCTEQTVPVSVAGEDQLVNVGSLVTLDASQSYDGYVPDGDDLAYYWVCYSAPETQVLLSDDGRTAVTSFTPNLPGNYYFRLTVRDKVDDTNFNRSPVSYVRVSAVADMNQDYINANAGRTQQAYIGQQVTLDGSKSQGNNPITSYTWVQENPLGLTDIQNMANLLGTTGCQGQCYRSNFDANTQVDGLDLALLSANYAAVELPDQAVVQFVAGIARPHIFRLTVNDGSLSDNETTIVAVSHLNAAPVLTHPPVENSCLE